MFKEKLVNFWNKYFIIISGLIGILIFLFIYGTSTLNVTYDSWIFSGYMEDDIEQHYAGWTHFRNSDWSFPLGLAKNLTYPEGTLISYMDSIPSVAIILKLFRNILPETFQFFGIYVLLCFVLQIISAEMLIKLFTKNKLYIILGGILFAMSPIMIERAFRHTSLASHWLILFALYLHFKSRREDYKFKWQFVLINSLAISTHPYLMVMTLAITFANFLENMLKKKNYKQATIFLVINIAVTLVVGIIIGAIAGSTSLGDMGYGLYNMNLNALVNPTSLGVSTWSSFLKTRGQTIWNYDGFNYLGLGVLLIGGFLILNYIISNNFKDAIEKLKICIKNNIGLVVVSIILTIFAISNNITAGGRTILSIPLPGFIERLCTIFRASGRMFCPVFYLIFLSEFVYILRKYKGKHVVILLVLLVGIQFIDLKPAFAEKRAYFKEPIEQTILNTEVWQKLAKADEMYFVLENYKENFLNKKYLAAYTGKNRIRTNIDIKSRQRETHESDDEAGKVFEAILAGKNPLGKSGVFITDNNDFFMYAQLNLNDELMPYEEDNYKMIIPRVLLEK